MTYPLKSLVALTLLTALVFAAGRFGTAWMIASAAAAASLFAAESLRHQLFTQRIGLVIATSLVATEMTYVGCLVWRHWSIEMARLAEPRLVAHSFCAGIGCAIFALFAAIVVGVVHHAVRGQL